MTLLPRTTPPSPAEIEQIRSFVDHASRPVRHGGAGPAEVCARALFAAAGHIADTARVTAAAGDGPATAYHWNALVEIARSWQDEQGFDSSAFRRLPPDWQTSEQVYLIESPGLLS